MKTRYLLHLMALVAVALSAAILPGTASAGPVVYVAGTGNEFGTLDLTTGAFTQIAMLNLPGGPSVDNMYAMGVGSDGHLYGLDSALNASLYQIDTTTGGLTSLGTTGQSAIGGTTDSAGTMFVLSQSFADSTFYTLTPPSTTTNVVGPTGLFLAQGLVAVTADGSQLFATAYNQTSGLYDLYSVNVTTGVATDIGATSYGGTNYQPLSGLFVNGTLYGFDANNDIFTINTSTGALTLIGSVSGLGSGDYLSAAAVVGGQTIPEPSGVVMGLIAVVAVGSVGLLRRRQAMAIA